MFLIEKKCKKKHEFPIRHKNAVLIFNFIFIMFLFGQFFILVTSMRSKNVILRSFYCDFSFFYCILQFFFYNLEKTDWQQKKT